MSFYVGDLVQVGDKKGYIVFGTITRDKIIYQVMTEEHVIITVEESELKTVTD